MSAMSWAMFPWKLVRGTTLLTPWHALTSASMIWVAMLTYIGTTPFGSQPCVSVLMTTPRSA